MKKKNKLDHVLDSLEKEEPTIMPSKLQLGITEADL
jgi:hypothetical protein